ncbi:MAG: BrnT family toxin [Verrucomicrobia bacterium]|nr:MAG: BrnT family toxin [Verrucomicrobiota bacterium]
MFEWNERKAMINLAKHNVSFVRRYGDGETIRIISARPSNREEELGYTGRQD